MLASAIDVHRPLRYAMVGGGQGAFIGAVHRYAMALDSEMQLVAGALSSTKEKALLSGQALGLPQSRNHANWQSLLNDELQRSPNKQCETTGDNQAQ